MIYKDYLREGRSEEEEEQLYATGKLSLGFSSNWLNEASSIVVHFAVYFDPERFIASFLLFNYRSDYSFNYAGFFLSEQTLVILHSHLNI